MLSGALALLILQLLYSGKTYVLVLVSEVGLGASLVIAMKNPACQKTKLASTTVSLCFASTLLYHYINDHPRGPVPDKIILSRWLILSLPAWELVLLTVSTSKASVDSVSFDRNRRNQQVVFAMFIERHLLCFITEGVAIVTRQTHIHFLQLGSVKGVYSVSVCVCDLLSLRPLLLYIQQRFFIQEIRSFSILQLPPRNRVR